MKKITKPGNAIAPANRIEQIWEGARDVQDMLRDKKRREQRELPDYTDEGEDTKRTDVHVHVHQHSSPELEVETSVEVGPFKAKGVPRWVVVCAVLLVVSVTCFGIWLAARPH